MLLVCAISSCLETLDLTFLVLRAEMLVYLVAHMQTLMRILEISVIPGHVCRSWSAA